MNGSDEVDDPIAAFAAEVERVANETLARRVRIAETQAVTRWCETWAKKLELMRAEEGEPA